MWDVNSRRRILLVEDDEGIREAVEYALRRQGYHVVAMEDGDQACNWLARELPDLAVVDMMMPGSSGFVVARTIKEKSGERVPVLMMSGNTTTAHRDYAYAAGADIFLRKPFLPEELIDAVVSLCPPVVESPSPTPRSATSGSRVGSL